MIDEQIRTFKSMEIVYFDTVLASSDMVVWFIDKLN